MRGEKWFRARGCRFFFWCTLNIKAKKVSERLAWKKTTNWWSQSEQGWKKGLKVVGTFVQHSDWQSTSSASLMFTRVCTQTHNTYSFPPAHALVRVKGQPSTTPATHLFTAARVNWSSRTESRSCLSDLSKARTGEPDIWIIPRSMAPINLHSPPWPPSPAPPLPQPPCLSVTQHSSSSPLSPSLVHLSTLSRCLVMLSIRAGLYHSWRGLLSTCRAQLNSPCVFFVLFFFYDFCVILQVWVWVMLWKK